MRIFFKGRFSKLCVCKRIDWGGNGEIFGPHDVNGSNIKRAQCTLTAVQSNSL